MALKYVSHTQNLAFFQSIG